MSDCYTMPSILEYGRGGVENVTSALYMPLAAMGVAA